MPGPEERLWRSDFKVVGSQHGITRTGRHHRPGTNYGRCGYQDEYQGVSCRLSSSKIAGLHPSLSIGVALLALTLSGGLAQDVDANTSDAQDDGDSTSGSDIWMTVMSYVIIVLLVAASGMFSGLTLGLLGLDKIGLEIISNGDEPRIAAYAKKIQPVRANGNQLLCTLLLGNVAVNALLSIVMAELTSGLVGFFLATVIITIFGEIIPQAVCSRHALRIGSAVVPLVKVIMVILYPATKPISIVLDKILGDEIGTIHSRQELNELLKIHVKHGAIDVETGREVAGAMNYKEHTVRDVMTPIKDCFMLSVQEKLNFKTLSEIFKSGFSRIPVFDRDPNDIIGLLFTKDLIFIDPDDETPLRNFVQIFGRHFTVVWPDYTLGEVLKIFKQGKSHLSLVRDVNNSGEGDPFYEAVGIITLEDIIEEILGDEIVDETDAFVDVVSQLPVQRAKFDMSRLELLNANANKSLLSADEAKAVTSHLMANVPQFKGIKMGHVEAIIAASPVVDMYKKAQVWTSEPAPAEVLYRRGRTSTMCMLILTGKVIILAGRDGFQSDAGPWTVLAADALVEDEGVYKPDFSAHSGSDHLRCIRISKATFDNVLDSSTDGDGEVSEVKGCLESSPERGGGVGSSSINKTLPPKISADFFQATPPNGVDRERVLARMPPSKPRRCVPATGASLRILRAVSGSSGSSASLVQDAADASQEAGMKEREEKSTSLPPSFGATMLGQDMYENVLDKKAESIHSS